MIFNFWKVANFCFLIFVYPFAIRSELPVQLLHFEVD